MYFGQNCFIIIVCYVLVMAILVQTESNEFVQVETLNGVLRGYKTKTEANTIFNAFEGFPYAEAPIGNLRFRSPRSVKNWNGIYNATKEKSACLNIPRPHMRITGEEDCLYMNIYVPAPTYNQSDSESLAIIVFIHGGAYSFDSASNGVHAIDRFVDQGIILVTFNYRLDLFGFLCTGDDASPGNYAIKDVILALKWVNQNIEYFGGDKKRITIMGSSSGAFLVHFVRQAKLAQGLFQRAISNSGTSLSMWATAINPRQLAFRIGLFNGILTKNTKHLVERLRQIDAKTLQHKSIVPAWLDFIHPLKGLPFAPCIERQSTEAVVTDNSYELQKHGKYHHGELLHGFTSMEGRGLPAYLKYFEPSLEQYNANPSLLTPYNMHASRLGSKAVGSRIRSFYFQNQTINNKTKFIKFLGDNLFVRSILKTAEFQSKFDKVYLYQFSFIGGNNHVHFEPEGVSHAEEMQFMFVVEPEDRQKTPEAILTSQRVMQMWTNFAKYGNPTPQINDIVNVIWTPVNGANDSTFKTMSYLDIDTNLTLKTGPFVEEMQFWDELYNEYGHPPYNTY